MNELIKKFLTFGMTREQAKGAGMLAWRAVIVFGIGAGWGWFSAIGVPRFALADETAKQIDATKTTVVQRLQAQAAKMDKTVELLNRTLAAGVASQIRAQAAKRCHGKAGEREAANREIDRLQEDYQQYKNEKYDIPRCEDL